MLWPAPKVHFAQVRSDIVVLDLRTDAYSCLVDGGAWLRIEPDQSLTVASPEYAAALVDAGLAAPGPSPGRRTWTPATRAIAPEAPTRPLLVMLCASRLMASTLTFRSWTLSGLLAPSAPPRHRSARLVDALSAHRAVRPWIPFEGECLQTAYQLRHWLRACGHDPAWVFGVRTWPFAAHCWLQIGDGVVGDRLERVSRYTPILVA
ncbi:lasso peptide biosynthesis B2 protein [Brevundimonas bacteroides]|uniref:lasso peptide biosynthesis B2 protein n=1 Tax=Brevundimonas bacteroides TaxID=74311 RepID=UPI00049678B6|nr:lasso peptide biosynthesis B2 protein [Brevundimonas bacteroides]